ncbi:MAG: hypothetical protein HP491_11105 [Nitrospira sp.]|nr:hypothetical protein [Nitrospira sp.]MBH0180334.1 hypothetical protein [Nitrospira sp.]MBH0183928.1 hypothetical protein [Nitrospira sp.]
MRLLPLLFLSVLLVSPATSQSDDVAERIPLRTISLERLDSILPPGTHPLIERKAIEAFLAVLDRTPPDWVAVYGHGHHDPGHDERVFNLNRERDAAREGNPALTRRVAFVWSGELSQFDQEAKGYPVSVGPEFNQTSWGIVRFKPEEAPGNLRVMPQGTLVDPINRRLAAQKKVEVFVVMTGGLIPSESIVYDFSHEEEGRGLIMPVVRVERVDVLLKEWLAH